MPKREWTNEQTDAIYTKYTKDGKRCNVLVNAAAGSGKTAVLAERIVQSIIPSEKNPVPTDINKMLVVTFTNAAAAEMKERISDTLNERLEEADCVLAERLKRQQALLYDADIMTIDAFCIKAIRENFQLLDIDPGFSMADNAQLALMSEEAMEEVFEEGYESADEDFLLLCELYSDGRDDKKLADIISEVYNFTRSLPNPENWLKEKAELFLKKEDNPWLTECLRRKNALCKKAYKELKNAIEYIAGYSLGNFDDIDNVIKNNPPETENVIQFNWGKNYGVLCSEYMAAKELVTADWDRSAEILNYIKFEKWGQVSSVRNKDMEVTDKEIKGYVKGFRDRAKALLQNAAAFVCVPSDELLGRFEKNVYPTARAICNIVKKYEECFTRKKQQRNLLDFSDAELLCLKLFEENKEVCEIFCEKYDEILMDEYQDSNSLQEEIFKKISRGDNTFTVGDMKQSIYRFRRSDPMLFKSKCDSFKNDENAENRKIVLSKNFRSRKEVLESVNSVFERIMSEAAGDIDYDDEQRLNNGNTTYIDANNASCGGYLSECYVLESVAEDGDDDINQLNKAELEAAFIAHKISELKKNGYMVRDKDSYRKIQNRDITILMSSFKNVADVYIAALNREGIECFAESGGYFDRNEVKMVLSLIKIIQNPYCDIPLLGVLRSPIAGFSDDELAAVRIANEGLIYDALCAYSAGGDELAEKCRKFIERLNRWRDYSKYMTCDRLLWVLYEETGIYAFVGALYGGEEARANLRLLFERAKEYESSGYKGLFHFIKYIERLEKREDDMAGAKLVGEGHDVVRIMTIHKSKGLEFPVVFLAGCGKGFNFKEKNIPMHKEWGIGLEEINAEKNYRVPTLAKMVVSSANKAESISEEERKLYVAMTRAKEKLIVTGVINTKIKPAEEYEKNWDELLESRESKMEPEDVCNASCFMDWIAPVARFEENWIYRSVPYSMYLQDAEEEEIIYDKEVEISDFEYGREKLTSVPSKISVTELKSGGFFESEIDILPMPAFMMGEKEASGADRGNALHKVMQNLVPITGMDLAYIDKEIKGMTASGILTVEEAELTDGRKILAFYSSDIGKRALKSGSVMRETPFETDIPLSYFEGYEKYDETILLQGVIDCWFEEEGEIVLIDYKSDFYNSPEEVREKYIVQLDWYKYAIEKITGKKVKERYIYMFHNDDTLQC